MTKELHASLASVFSVLPLQLVNFAEVSRRVGETSIRAAVSLDSAHKTLTPAWNHTKAAPPQLTLEMTIVLAETLIAASERLPR